MKRTTLDERVQEIASKLEGDHLKDLAKWVVYRYAKDGPAMREPDPDEWALENIPIPAQVLEKCLHADDDFMAVFDLYMRRFESMNYKCLISNLVWENKVLRQLMSDLTNEDAMDFDKVNRGFDTGCKLSAESVKIRERNQALQESIMRSGSTTDRAMMNKASMSAESVADDIRRIKDEKRG